MNWYRSAIPKIALTVCVAGCMRMAPQQGAPVRSISYESHRDIACQALQFAVAPGTQASLCAALSELGDKYVSAKAVLRMPNQPGVSGLTALLYDASRAGVISPDPELAASELNDLEDFAKTVWQKAIEKENRSNLSVQYSV